MSAAPRSLTSSSLSSLPSLTPRRPAFTVSKGHALRAQLQSRGLHPLLHFSPNSLSFRLFSSAGGGSPSSAAASAAKTASAVAPSSRALCPLAP